MTQPVASTAAQSARSSASSQNVHGLMKTTATSTLPARNGGVTLKRMIAALTGITDTITAAGGAENINLDLKMIQAFTMIPTYQTQDRNSI